MLFFLPLCTPCTPRVHQYTNNHIKRLFGGNLRYEDGPVDVGQSGDAFLAAHVASIRLADTGADCAARRGRTVARAVFLCLRRRCGCCLHAFFAACMGTCVCLLRMALAGCACNSSNNNTTSLPALRPTKPRNTPTQNHPLSPKRQDPELSRKYGGTLLCWQYSPAVHVYQPSDEGAADDDEGEDGVPSYREWILPAR